MTACQFLRCHAYQSTKIGDVLAEADRQPGFISHILKPDVPVWSLGSPNEVRSAIAAHMTKSAPVQSKNGTLVNRKRRRDHRCLVAGTISWPNSIAECLSKDYPREKMEALKKWYQQSRDWLQKQFGDKLIGLCVHRDESHPHIHFFVVGDAQRLHPGMKNELVDNKRMVVPADRFVAHKLGLKAWLDDFHVDVGQQCGLERSLGSRPAWRIKDRGTRARLFEIDKALSERPDTSIQQQRDGVWDSELKTQMPRLVF